MKNILIILFILCSISGFSQVPITRTLSNVNNTADSLKPVSVAQKAAIVQKLQTVSSIANLQAFTDANIATFDGSQWERKAGNVASNGGAFAGTIINVSSSFYWERKTSSYYVSYFGYDLQLTINSIPIGSKIIIDANVNLTSDITCSKYISFVGENGSKIYSSVQRNFTLNSFTSIENLTFDKVQLSISSLFTDNAKITKCNFVNNAIAIYGVIGFSVCPKNLTISENTFDTNGYAIYGGMSSSKILSNTMTNGTRNIELSYAENTIIDKNNITGGVTGITFLNNIFTNQCKIGNNSITNNTVKNITEEAISFDVHGNSSANSGSIANGIVQTVTLSGASNVRITSNTALPAFAWLDYFVCFTTGLNKGKIYQINYMGSGSEYLQIPNPYNAITIGDNFVIQIAIHDCIVQGNKISNCFSGIVIWGNGFQNLINDNFVNNCFNVGIGLYTLTDVVAGGAGLSENNTINSNVLTKANLDVKLFKFGTTDYYSTNTVIDNKLVDGVINYSYQTSNLYNKNNNAIMNITNIQNTTGLLVTSLNSKIGDITITKSDVGLSLVDNISDVNKPISTIQQTAFNSKQNLVTGTISTLENTQTFTGANTFKTGSMSGMTLISGNTSTNNRIFIPTSGLEIQSNETTNLPIFSIFSQSNERLRVFQSGTMSIGTTSEYPSSLLSLESTSKGFLIPRMTTTQRNAISSPIEGLQLYNFTTKSREYFNGTVWITGTPSGLENTQTFTGANTFKTGSMSGMTLISGNTSTNNRIFIPTSGLEIQSNETTNLPIFSIFSQSNERLRVFQSGTMSIGTTSEYPSSLLSLESTSKGFLVPRMTTTQRDAISGPSEGIEIYNLTTHAKEFFNGTIWKTIVTN